MERFLRVKLEPVDIEHNPDNRTTHKTFDLPSSPSPPLSRVAQNRHPARKDMEFVSSKELSHTHQIISELSGQLERAQKKLTSQEETIRHQEELLMRTEADHKIDKAIKDAEIAALRKLLEEEKRRRIISEQRFKKLLEARKTFMAQRLRRPTNSTTAATGGASTFKTPSQNHGNNFRRTEIRPYRPTGTSVTGRNSPDDIVVLNEIPRVPKNIGSTTITPVITTNRRLVDDRPVADDNWRRNPVWKFPCKICGLVFNSHWKLISHAECHRSQKRPFIRRFLSSPGKNTAAKTVQNTERSRSTVDFIWKKPVSNVSVNLSGGLGEGTSSSMHARRPQKIPSGQALKLKFSCNVCGHRFEIVSKLKTHMRQAHGLVDETFVIGCKDCGKVFSTRRQHVRHRRTVHGTLYSAKRKEATDESYTPSQASSTSGSSEDAPASRPTEETEVTVPPPAEPCSSKTLTPNNTPSKTSQDHGVDSEKASEGNFCICGRSFRTPTTLDEHIRHNNQERKCICDICGMMFREVMYLKLHMNQAHGGKEPIELPEGSQILPPPPPEDDTGAGSDAAADTKDDPIVLPGNEESRHTLVGEDPEVNNAKYLCSCGRSYTCRSSFMTHSRSKNNGKIFKCTLCAYSFDLHGNLKTHVRKAHKVKYGHGKYACSSCAQTFETSTLLVRHRFYLCKYRVKNRREKLKK